MKKNLLINEIMGQYMEEQGFQLKTDKRSYWDWSKKVLDVEEKIVICDKHHYLQLLLGNSVGNCSYVVGNELLHTIDTPRTQSSQWDYSEYKGDLEKLYRNILYDMHDIVVENWERVLEEQALEYKKDVPNRKHFEMYVKNYDNLAREAMVRYGVDGKDILDIYDVLMSQIKSLQNKELEIVEDTLLVLAAMFEKTIADTYGGERFINTDIGAIVLLEVGRTRKVFNILKLVFLVWKNPEYYEDYRKDFLHWYRREEAMH